MTILFYYVGKVTKLKLYQRLPTGEIQWLWFSKTGILKNVFR